MKVKYYAANAGESLLQVTKMLGRSKIDIGVADKHLNWKWITLDTEQTEAFIKFIKDTDI